MHQYCNLGDTIYFWFAANDTSGSGADGTAPQFVVREGGGANNATPFASGTPVLLTHASYPSGCYEIAVDTDGTYSYGDGNSYGIFCTLSVSSQNPTGYVGSFTINPVPSDVVSITDAAARRIQGVLWSGTVADVPTSTSMSLGSSVDGATWTDQLLIMINADGTVSNVRTITGGSSGTVTFTPAADGWEGTGDYYLIIPNSSAEAITGGKTFVKNTIALGTSATSFTGQSTLSSTNDFYTGCALTFTSGANAGQTRPVTGYTGSLRRFTVSPAFPVTPTSEDSFTLMGYFNL